MADYTVGLALFDYLPVLAAGVGLVLICRYCALAGQINPRWLMVIAGVVILAGLLKATWKLIWVVTAKDIGWMSDQLFFLLSSGYVLLAATVLICFRSARRGVPANPAAWLAPVLLTVAVVAIAIALKILYAERYWAFVLLGILALSNLVFGIRLIMHARARGNIPAMLGFAVNLILAFVLVGLARIPQQTLALQWLEESLNLASNCCLALAAWFLSKMDRRIGQFLMPAHKPRSPYE